MDSNVYEGRGKGNSNVGKGFRVLFRFSWKEVGFGLGTVLSLFVQVPGFDSEVETKRVVDVDTDSGTREGSLSLVDSLCVLSNP